MLLLFLLLFYYFVDWQWCQFQYCYEGVKDKLGQVPSSWEDCEGYLGLDEEVRGRPWRERQPFDVEGNVCVEGWDSLEINSSVYLSESEEAAKTWQWHGGEDENPRDKGYWVYCRSLCSSRQVSFVFLSLIHVYFYF